MAPIRLLFDSCNHLLVTNNGAGRYDLADVEAAEYEWHELARMEIDGQSLPILCAVLPERAETLDNWQTIYKLRTLPQAPQLTEVLRLIDSQLYRIPYLGMGENEYIYRFRTSKERNRAVYVDDQSEALYQSALCLAIN